MKKIYGIYRKNKIKKEKLRDNPWKTATFVLGIFVIFCIASSFITINKEMNDLVSLETLCEKATATPSWFNWRGGSMGSGVIMVKNNTVDKLIFEKIYFVYNSNCGWCKKQIELFGFKWEEYEESGFTRDCSKLNNGGKK